MAVQVTIYNVTGQTPFDVYICQSGGTGCFYMTTISTLPYTFDIPVPYNNATSYMLKLIDDNGCVITSVQEVTPCYDLDCTISGGTINILDCTLSGGTVIIYP